MGGEGRGGHLSTYDSCVKKVLYHDRCSLLRGRANEIGNRFLSFVSAFGIKFHC